MVSGIARIMKIFRHSMGTMISQEFPCEAHKYLGDLEAETI